MATLSITNFVLTPLNPDGTDNSLITPLSGSLPPSESVDFAAMGERFKLELECEYSGTYSDTSTANVAASYIRYNPAMFVDAFSSYPFVGTFPNAGYMLQIPNTSASTYTMPLSFVTGEFINANENGVVTLEVTDSTHFKITHFFRITEDLEGYLNGGNIFNQTRLTKNSKYNAQELENDRPTVFGTQKAFNAIVASKQRNFVLIADELSVLFRASFNGFDSDGDEMFAQTVTFERFSTEVDSLSALEDTKVTLSFVDPSAKILIDEATVLLAIRKYDQNIAGFEKDLDIQECKLVTTGSTAIISGPFKGPVAYTQAAGVTTVSFYVDKDEVEISQNYDLHSIVAYQKDVSEVAMFHHALKTTTLDFDSQPVDTNMSSQFYSRNGNTAEDFTATVMERISNSMVIDVDVYDTLASLPFTTFWQDLAYATFSLKDALGNELFAGAIGKNTTNNTMQSTDLIEVDVTDADKLRLTVNDFRIPYENFQNLPNLGPEATNEYTWTWFVYFTASADDRYNVRFETVNVLTIRPYENSENEPSEAPKVSNIRFIDPSTGRPISNWCDFTSILVLADCEDLGSDTLVNVLVDKYPLGANFKNDYALEEENPDTHTLPTYISIPQLSSDLVSNLTINATDGIISFLLDVSLLSGEEKYRVSVMTYKANP
jgi:hypothetical protein